MSSEAFRKIRSDCYEAMSSSYVETLDTGSLVDDIFDIVTKAIREHFGIRFQTIDLILRDARIEAGNLFDEENLDDFVNIDQTIETIARHLAEEIETRSAEANANTRGGRAGREIAVTPRVE